MPHTMKKYIFCAIAMVLFLLSACKTNEDPQSSPRIYTSHFTRNPATWTGKVDTLNVKIVSDVYVVDTINVGDTIHVDILLNAVTNQLTGFTLDTDTTYLKYTIEQYKELLQAVTSDTDFANGKIFFKTGYSGASLPIFYIARKSGKATIALKVTSDSEYSPSTLTFTQPIR